MLPLSPRLLLTIAIILGVVLTWVAVNATPIWEPQTILEARDQQRRDNFGAAIAVDGDTLVVTKTMQEPTAYVFVKTESGWVEQATLRPDPMDSAKLYGRSVALSGNTIAVTAADSRAVYVFTRQGTTWTQQAHLVPPDSGRGSYFGDSVALDDDTLVVGETRNVHVFTRNLTTGVWSYATRIAEPYDPVVSNKKITLFSGAVALSGNTIVIAGKHRLGYPFSLYRTHLISLPTRSSLPPSQISRL